MLLFCYGIKMLKKILFTLLTLLMIYSTVIIAYKINEPQKIESRALATALSSAAIPYSTLKDYTLNSGESAIHYYFFCSGNDQNCTYVENTVLKSVENSTNLNLDSLLEYVDLSDESEDAMSSPLSDWGINTYPAFVVCNVSQGSITVSNPLEWNASSPMSADDIIRWLSKVGLYNNPSEEEAINTPAS